MTYKPVQHWETKSESFLKNPSFRQKMYRKQLLSLIKCQIDKYQPKKLLEVGVGPGRLFPIYKNLDDVSGIDFSNGMVLRAARTAAMLGLDIKLHRMSASCMEFLDDSFDMVVCSNVLQHITPELILEVVKEIHRVCKGVIVCVEYFEKEPNEISDFCFFYDYPKLFARKGWELITNKKLWLEKQRLFVFEYNNNSS